MHSNRTTFLDAHSIHAARERRERRERRARDVEIDVIGIHGAIDDGAVVDDARAR